jgi:hypothetical protein
MLSKILDQERNLINEMKLLDYNIEQRTQGNIPGFEKLRSRLRSMWEEKEEGQVDIGQIKRVENKFKEVGFKAKGMFDIHQMQNWKPKGNNIPLDDINGDYQSPNDNENVNIDNDQKIVQNYFMKKKSVSLRRNGMVYFIIN